MSENRSSLGPETIRALVRLVEENSLAELTLVGEGFAVSLKAEGVAQGVAARPAAPTPVAPAEEEAPRVRIRAPMTGVFYRAPAPGEPPFIEVGDHVEVGQVIGLIEAMKVFSEVPADAAGRVVEIPAKNGELVHEDQPLALLAPEEEERVAEG